MTLAAHSQNTDFLTGFLTDLSPAIRADLLAALATKVLESATAEDKHGVRCDPDAAAETIGWLLPGLTPNLNQDDHTRREMWKELKYSLQILDASPDTDTSRLERDLQDPQSYETACIDRVRSDLSALVGAPVHWQPN